MKVARTVLGGTLFEILMKSTFYGHFVAGENRHTIIPTLERFSLFFLIYIYKQNKNKNIYCIYTYYLQKY